MRKTFFRSFAIWLFFVFVMNSLASYLYWYSNIGQFDMFMHFVGGFTAALFSFWLGYRKFASWIENGHHGRSYRVVFLMVIVIALLWEIMEFAVQGYFGVTVLADMPDSMSDLLMGALGAIAGILHIRRKYKKEKLKRSSV